ncbi:MAG: NAD(P)/FAD-dependent oxidoreductase [Methanophagales archaeon ANME-1-THS]|nr:MAG: NAD(P)/FAD-dependent oxidoreductase [Methanophagales archaeon ANME-1-THS]
MVMLEYDVVVVGGGPAGCMAAKYAAKGGASTLILEEHAEIGKPVHCAGLISRRAIEESELLDTSFITSEIKGAVVYSPSSELILESPDQRAFAIRRDAFDQALARSAAEEGAELLPGHKVNGIGKREGEQGLIVTAHTMNREEKIRATVVIGADGVRSSVAKMAGLTTSTRRLSCVQLEGAYTIGEPFAEIFVGRTIAPGFFAWVIPLGAETARIGLCIDKTVSPQPSPMPFLKRMVLEHPVIAKKYKGTRSKVTVGMIPLPLGLGYRGHHTVKADKNSGILLVGDAAAQIKPITGGGVYYGMICGKIAGEIAAQASLNGDMKRLKEYERRWRRAIGREITFGLKVHRLRCVMSDRDLDTVLQTLSRHDIAQHLRKTGDMDYPARALRELIKNPRLLNVMARNILKYLYIKQG